MTAPIVPDIVREALAATFEQRPGFLTLVAAAVRAIDPATPLPAAPVQGWQPIETAPKDGTEVLLYLPAPYDRVAKAAWFEPWGNWIEGDKPDLIHDEYGGIGSLLPTHYMLLPPPPVGEKE